MSKYILTDDVSTTENGVLLHRIQAVRDIAMYGIKAGDMGGLIASESNLSQQGNCWVYPQASVVNGIVEGDARVSDYALILGGTIAERAIISGSAKVRDEALIAGDAVVGGAAQVMGEVKALDFALIYGSALIFDCAKVFEQASVCDNAQVSEDGWVFGNAVVAGNTHISGKVRFNADAVLEGSGHHRGRQIMDDAYIERYHQRLRRLMKFDSFF